MPNGAQQPSCDIFVSYAHVDNEPPPGVRSGWVSTFVEGMMGYLARELGRREDVRLWMDYELRGNQSVTAAIHQQLAASKVLVLFLSKGYVSSEWCREELESFHKRVDGKGARIFPVYVSPVDEIPEPLADLVCYDLWRSDERGRPRILGDPQPRPATEPEYYNRMRDLARDLADTLSDIEAATPGKQGSDGAAKVFVGAADDDRALVRDTAVQLASHGLSCLLPLTALDSFDATKSTSAEIRGDLESKLADSDAVVLLYRDGPVTQIGQTIREVQKLHARNERIPDHIDLCQPHPDPTAVGVLGPGLNVLVTSHHCAEDCADQIVGRLGQTGQARQ